MATRWTPPLPSLGRAGPRILVEPSSTYLHKLEDYYCEFRSCASIFERRVSPGFQEKVLRVRNAPAFLDQFEPRQQKSLLLRNLYYRTSQHFATKLQFELDQGKLGRVRQWWHTADATVLPLLISSVEEPAHNEVDHLTRWALENCANNYALFQRDFKSLKKAMRKAFALKGHIDDVPCKATMLPYLRSCQKKQDFDGPTDFGRYVLLWTQTRATGLADNKMLQTSIEKFISTVSTPSEKVQMDPAVLIETLGGARDADPSKAVLSVGTTACLEKTRAKGGKTTFLQQLARSKSLKARYNFETLEPEYITPVPVRTSEDVLNWAVHNILHHPAYVRCVRVHVVAEPGKARTITVAPYAYQVLMGIFAHVYQATLKSKGVQSGLRADRHLWRFLQQTLNPQNENWDTLQEGNVYALSTDLSEATDFGNKDVAREVLHYMIRLTPGMPRGLSVLMKTLYCSKRYCFVPQGRGFGLVTAKRSWLMGDMMTKFMLTVVHDYCCRLSLLSTYTLVGDDEIALSSHHKQLSNHLLNLEKFFKISEDDTYISEHFAFYCEEGTILPQYAHDTNHVRMRRGKELLYLDYPRIRLLIPTQLETDAYSATNQGRFALLGKESRWVNQVNQDARLHFAMASLYQHILVPQDRDTLCPFTPLEMGGDGGFPHSPEFLRRVVDDKTHNPRETKFRMVSLLNNMFSHKFVRSDRLDKVVHKHHLYLPKLEGLKGLLPPEAVLEPRTEEAKIMLRSMRFREIEKPQQTFFRLARGLYYKDLLQGRTPAEPVFSIDRKFDGGQSEPQIEYRHFIEKWRNPGFSFQDIDTYFVYKSKIPGMDPMNLGWSKAVEPYPSSRDLFNDWAEREISFEEMSFPAVLSMIQEGTALPPRVVQRLNLVLESDSYIIHMIPDEPKEIIGIVTRDIKLCHKVRYACEGRTLKPHYVLALDPVIYLTGRVDDTYRLPIDIATAIPVDQEYIPDPGAMLHVDYTEFTDGFPHDLGVFDHKVIVAGTYAKRVSRVTLQR